MSKLLVKTIWEHYEREALPADCSQALRDHSRLAIYFGASMIAKTLATTEAADLSRVLAAVFHEAQEFMDGEIEVRLKG